MGFQDTLFSGTASFSSISAAFIHKCLGIPHQLAWLPVIGQCRCMCSNPLLFVSSQEHIMGRFRLWLFAIVCTIVGIAAVIVWRSSVGAAGPANASGIGPPGVTQTPAAMGMAATDPLIASVKAVQAANEIKLALRKLGVDDSGTTEISRELGDLLLVLRHGSWSDMEDWRSSRGISPRSKASDAAEVWENNWSAQVAVLRTAIPVGPARVNARVINGKVIEPSPPQRGQMHLGVSRKTPDKGLPSFSQAEGNWYEVMIPVTVGDASGRSAEILISVLFARRAADGRWIASRIELLNVPMELECLVPNI